MDKVWRLKSASKRVFAVLVVGLVIILPACSWPAAPCSKAFLVNAINSANLTPATSDVINLAAGCIYQLDTVDNSTDGFNGLPSVISPIVINGNGATIRRSLSSQKMALRLFHVSSAGSLELNNVILLDGLGMNPVDVSLPVLNYGGGVYNNGQLSINNSQLIQNRAARQGGAIYNAAGGTMVINNSTLEGNQAMLPLTPGEHGGAIANLGAATISNSTLFNNQATETGGAISNQGSLYITNSTFSTNLTMILNGSAIVSSGALEIEYSTIAHNIGAGPGVAVFSTHDSIEIRNSILAYNTGGNCSYPATSPIGEENLSDDASCNSFTMIDDPQLDPLADNGGPTMTHALAPSSPAKNAATGSCPAADQRGQPRPHGPACDLGAYEISGTSPPTSTPVTSQQGGSISGFTYIDANDNGVRDAAEVTDFVSGAMLTLAQGPCPGIMLLSTAESSGVDGSYQFNGLPAGDYCVLTSELQQTLDPTSQAVALSAGEDLTEINFRYVPSPMATLTRTPTATYGPTFTFTPTPFRPTLTSTPARKQPADTPTPEVKAQIYVNVWKDLNANGVRDSGEDAYENVRVYVGHGSCNNRASGSRTELTNGEGTAFFDDVPFMTYCVTTNVVRSCSNYWSAPSTSVEVTIVVDHGAAWVINIGYAPNIC